MYQCSDCSEQLVMERRKALTVQEALQLILEDDSDSDVESAVDLVVLPPSTVDDVSDEEGDDDIIGGDTSIRDVPGNVETHVSRPKQTVASQTRDEGQKVILSSTISDEESDANAAGKGASRREPKNKRQKYEQTAKWKQSAPQYSKMLPQTSGAKAREQAMHDELGNKSPVELFEELFSE